MHPDLDSDRRSELAVAWFGDVLREGEWVNFSWISRRGEAEVRLLDVVGPTGRHRVLVGLDPSDGASDSYEDLDFAGVQEVVDRVRGELEPNGFITWEFAGPATEAPS